MSMLSQEIPRCGYHYGTWQYPVCGYPISEEGKEDKEGDTQE